MSPQADRLLRRSTLFAAAGTREWMSALFLQHQRRLREVNEAEAQGKTFGTTNQLREHLRSAA